MGEAESVYLEAREHPVAGLVLEALHEQDAATYHGRGTDDAGTRALALARAVEEVVARRERHRLADLIEKDMESLSMFVNSPERAMGLLVLMLRLDHTDANENATPDSPGRVTGSGRQTEGHQ